MACPGGATIGNAVFTAVSRAYEKLPAKGKPAKTPVEWTMLAGIVALDGAGGCHPIAIATGNKCIGKRDMQADGSVLHDCHAEVLARRAFNRYLLEEMRAHVALCRPVPDAGGAAASSCGAGLTSCHWGLLQHDTGSGSSSGGGGRWRFALRPGVTLHLYISDSPCGDAAVYNDAAGQAGAEEEEVAAGGAAADDCGGAAAGAAAPAGQRRTGAKLVVIPAGDSDTAPAGSARDVGDGATDADTDSTAPGALRTKSGRSDLPPDRRTLSMCCSDKVARWLACGLQSGVVARWLAEPLFLASVTVSAESLGFHPSLGSSPSLLGAPSSALVTVPPVSVAPSSCAVLSGSSGSVDDVAASPLWPQMAALQRALWTRGAAETAAAQSAFQSVPSDTPEAAGVTADVASSSPHLPVLCVLPQRFCSSRASLATALPAAAAVRGTAPVAQPAAASPRVAGGKRERPASSTDELPCESQPACEPPAKRLAVGDGASACVAAAAIAVASATGDASTEATICASSSSAAAAPVGGASSLTATPRLPPLAGGSGSGAAIVPSGSSLNAYRSCDGYARLAAVTSSNAVPGAAASGAGASTASSDAASVAPLALATTWTSEGVAASRGCVLGPSLKAPKHQRMSRLCKANIAALAALVHAAAADAAIAKTARGDGDGTGTGMTYAQMKTTSSGAGGIIRALVASKAAFHAPGGRFAGWLFCSRGCEDFAVSPPASAAANA